jgi:two-component system sensor histidine kinase KdpD
MSASSSDETSDNRDRFMVYVDLHSSNNEMLLQYAWWLADATQGKWYVVDVQTESDDEQSSNGLRLKIHALARQLGAMVSTYKGEDVASIILNFASEHQIGHILIEKPGKRSWRKRLFNKPNLLERLTNESRGYSLIVYDPPAYLT